jgi:hypothetical protein
MALREFLAQLAVDLAMPVNALMGYSAYALYTITFSSFVSNSTSTPYPTKKMNPKLRSTSFPSTRIIPLPLVTIMMLGPF